MQSMLGTTHPLFKLVVRANKNDECTVVPTQHNYVHLNFTNLNGRTIIENMFCRKKRKNYVSFLSAGQTIFLFLSLFI